MPHKDPEARRAYCRAHYAKLKDEDPERIAKLLQKQSERYKRKYAEDEVYREKRKAMFKRWYERFGCENARERKGYIPWEEWEKQQAEKRRTSAERMREWCKTPKGQRYKVAQTIKKRCGLSIDDYDRIYDEQSGRCLICGAQKPRYTKDRLVVDHCHTTGRFRGLLCGKCNIAIGLFGENEMITQNAIEYLRERCSLATGS